MSGLITHDHVGVGTPDLIYVIIADREKFDKINRPATEHSNGLITKTIGSLKLGDATVIFQWWPSRLPAGSPEANRKAPPT